MFFSEFWRTRRTFSAVFGRVAPRFVSGFFFKSGQVFANIGNSGRGNKKAESVERFGGKGGETLVSSLFLDGE